jgi:hypothetical protein
LRCREMGWAVLPRPVLLPELRLALQAALAPAERSGLLLGDLSENAQQVPA